MLGKEKQENWRASLVPAAAVIPTPRVCMRDAAVKKSVVAWLETGGDPSHGKWRSQWGAQYTRARDEMSRPLVDSARRKRCSRGRSVIKDEGWRIESD